MASDTSTVSTDQLVEERRRELAEAREQQAATAEILAVISSLVTDANQVFAKIAASAARLCDASDAPCQADRRDARRPHLGTIDARQRLDLYDGAACPRRVPEERAMSRRVPVLGRPVLHTLKVLGPVCRSALAAPCS